LALVETGEPTVPIVSPMFVKVEYEDQ